MPSNVISRKLKIELLNRDEGEPLLGAAKRSNYRLKMNFSANKSVIDPSAVQCWHRPPLQTRPMESRMWKQGILTRARPSSVQHTDIFQTKATESHKKLSFLTTQKICCSDCTVQSLAWSSHDLTDLHSFYSLAKCPGSFVWHPAATTA